MSDPKKWLGKAGHPSPKLQRRVRDREADAVVFGPGDRLMDRRRIRDLDIAAAIPAATIKERSRQDKCQLRATMAMFRNPFAGGNIQEARSRGAARIDDTLPDATAEAAPDDIVKIAACVVAKRLRENVLPPAAGEAAGSGPWIVRPLRGRRDGSVRDRVNRLSTRHGQLGIGNVVFAVP